MLQDLMPTSIHSHLCCWDILINVNEAYDHGMQILHSYAAKLFTILIAPALQCDCKVWQSQKQRRLAADARELQGVQPAFSRNVCGRLPVYIPVPAILADLAQDP